MDADIELATLTSLLDLDEFEVVESNDDRPARLRRLTLAAVTPAGLCPCCGQVSGNRHACHDRRVLDLPLGAWHVELTVRLWQFECDNCKRFFTPRFAALADGAHATERFLERLAEFVCHGDVANAARFLGIAEKTAEDWYYAYLERRQRGSAPPPPQPVRSLGIDELSLKKDSASSAAC